MQHGQICMSLVKRWRLTVELAIELIKLDREAAKLDEYGAQEQIELWFISHESADILLHELE